MLWRCKAYGVVGDFQFTEDKINAVNYINVLRNNLLINATKLGITETFWFQQDNDPKHTVSKTKEWLSYNVRRQLVTPPQSPNINPIENL